MKLYNTTTKTWLLAFSTLAITSANAQLVTNNGALIAIKDGATVIVKTGAVNNASGTVDNEGTFVIEGYFENNDLANGGNSDGVYRVQGNWENNATFTADSSQVELYGADQLITGTSVTEFHQLTLTGTGVKTQTIDARVNSLLELNDRELATDGNNMFVDNVALASITRSTGYVSSTGNGRLVREMAVAGDYLFPTGSSAGVTRYRPVVVTTSNTLNNTFEVRMANVDATSEGFNRNTRETGICDINPNYYHLIGRTQGVDPVAVTTFYDAATETDWSLVTNWKGLPQWERTNPAALLAAGTPFNTLTLSNYNTFTNEPFAFAIPSPDIDELVSKVNDATCFGIADGSIDIEVIDGTGPFDFNWTPGNINTEDITGLAPDTYTVTINDVNNCAVDFTFTVDQPLEILLTATPSDVSCAGGNNGGLNLTVTNGIPNFQYLWSPGGAVVEDVTGLDAGTYSVVVTDNNDCEKTATFTVSEPTEVSVELEATDISCNNANDGTIDLTVNGGTPNYSYSWSDTTNLEDLESLQAGTYSVTVTDNNGCIKVASAQIINPELGSVQASNDTIIAITFNANLSEVTTLGGTPAYTYTWFDSTTNTQVGTGEQITVTPEQNTTYKLVAVDARGCETVDYVNVRVDVNLYDFPSGFSPNGDNEANQGFGIIASPTVELLNIKVFNRWGQLVYEGKGNNAKWDGTFKGESQPMDNYVFQAEVKLPDGTTENKNGNVILVW